MTDSYILITGGCGFVGTNVADRLLREGHRVCVFDNLSRAGVERNLQWLREQHGDALIFKQADTRDAAAVREAVRRASHIFHFAAQVAVTTSLDDPIGDFEVNARSALNVLEAVRHSLHRPPLFFTSTNKVYGGLDDVRMREEETRYTPRLAAIARHGVSEKRPLDFHSPYGCSKGAADQYIRDYARSYGLRTVVFRMSCIYGPHQFGTEDQGWVAHFLIRALRREPITIYGDGKQVRDILFIDDLTDAFMLAMEHVDACSGEAFNIGGGPENTVSLREVLGMIRRMEGREPRVDWGAWRTGDQKYYVSDTRRFEALTGWSARTRAADGILALREWLLTSGVPEILQRADERPPLAAKAAISGGGGRVSDRPAVAAPAKE
ncbi:MAG TPA: SDR family NAD(P)-dependent oxidoreductase [Thermoanaerobaculia bacterium]|jgi:CDP-paratose 2-epimerase